MARILVSGASGYIGKPLISFFSSLGHSVIPLTRIPSPRAIFWQPDIQKARPSDFEGFDAVIHLAGDPLTLTRWSPQKKEAIFKSRVQGTQFLSRLLSLTSKPPSLFISASGCGFYGDRQEEILTEASPVGKGFLASVCLAWEKATFELEQKGTRVVHTRFGMVLSPDGGVLRLLISLYRRCLGGRLGSGRQWVSWIHRDDLIRAMAHLLDHPALTGPVNFVSPNPLRQKELSALLAEYLHRPRLGYAPAWVLRLLYGGAADELLLASVRVQCAKLLQSHFKFDYPDISSILNSVC